MSGRVMIAEDSGQHRVLLRATLMAGFFDVVVAATPGEVLARARATRPDVIILRTEFDGGKGAGLCRRLRADPALAHVPVVLTLRSDTSSEEMEAGLAAGADDVMRRPVPDALLFARLRNLIRAKTALDPYLDHGLPEREKPVTPCALKPFGLAEAPAAFRQDVSGSICVLAPDLAAAEAICRDLRTAAGPGISVTTAHADATDPPGSDVYLLDGRHAPIGRTVRLAGALRASPATRRAALVVLLPRGADTARLDLLELGVDDVPAGDVRPAELARRLHNRLVRKRSADSLRDALAKGLRDAMIDPLTGLGNRRSGLDELDRFRRLALTRGRGFALLLADIDRFKTINDRHGHRAGDEVLRSLGLRLRAALGKRGHAARIGGEEFLVLLPDASPETAGRLAERLRRAVGDTPFALPCGGSVPITISIGVACVGPGAPLPEAVDLVERADRAMYGAKAGGRNRVTFEAAADTLRARRPAIRG